MGHRSTQHSSHHAENTGKKKASLACNATQTSVHSAAWVLQQSQTFLVSSFSSSISWWTLGAVILLWELHLTPFFGDTTSGSCEFCGDRRWGKTAQPLVLVPVAHLQ